MTFLTVLRWVLFVGGCLALGTVFASLCTFPTPDYALNAQNFLKSVGGLLSLIQALSLMLAKQWFDLPVIGIGNIAAKEHLKAIVRFRIGSVFARLITGIVSSLLVLLAASFLINQDAVNFYFLSLAFGASVSLSVSLVGSAMDTWQLTKVQQDLRDLIEKEEGKRSSLKGLNNSNPI